MEPVILIYVGGALLFVGIAVTLYVRASSSRRVVTCPACGEKQRTELMEATRCSVCGAPMKQNQESS